MSGTNIIGVDIIYLIIAVKTDGSEFQFKNNGYSVRLMVKS